MLVDGASNSHRVTGAVFIFEIPWPTYRAEIHKWNVMWHVIHSCIVLCDNQVRKRIAKASEIL